LSQVGMCPNRKPYPMPIIDYIILRVKEHCTIEMSQFTDAKKIFQHTLWENLWRNVLKLVFLSKWENNFPIVTKNTHFENIHVIYRYFSKYSYDLSQCRDIRIIIDTLLKIFFTKTVFCQEKKISFYIYNQCFGFLLK